MTTIESLDQVKRQYLPGLLMGKFFLTPENSSKSAVDGEKLCFYHRISSNDFFDKSLLRLLLFLAGWLART